MLNQGILLQTVGSPFQHNFTSPHQQNKENRDQNSIILRRGNLKQCFRFLADTNLKPADKELSIQQSTLAEKISRESQWIIFRFLTAFEIHTKIKVLNKQFRNEVEKMAFWIYYDRHQKLSIQDKYMRMNCLVERRSKGKLFKVVSLLNQKPYTLRVVDVKIANANYHDGLPTSIMREVSYLKTLAPHDNLNRLIEVEQKSHSVSLIYDFQPFNLKDVVRQRKNNEDQFWFSIMRQIAQGMQYLHSCGIMHRNLKPENILLTNDLQVKLSDFSLSRLVQGLIIPFTPENPQDRERSGRESRRMWYRAPEILLGKSLYSHEVDVWSFGCVLAEVALGEPVFCGDGELAQLIQVFKFIGSPSLDDWVALSDDDTKKYKFLEWTQYPLNTKNVGCLKAYKQEMTQSRHVAYEQLIRLNQILGEKGMDLLEGCLKIRPLERLTFAEIIQHPWMNQNPLQVLEISNARMPPGPKFVMYLPDFQPHITWNMRAILVDWLIDVAQHFGLMQETLHLAVTYTDLMLAFKVIETKQLQLIGVTAMKMADIYNERSREYYKQESCQDYSYITADEYPVHQMIDMEREIFTALQHKLTYTTTSHLVKRNNHHLVDSSEVGIVAKFFSDFFLQIHETLVYDNQILSWSYLFLAQVAVDDGTQIKRNEALINFSPEEFLKCVEDLKQMWLKWRRNSQTNQLDAVHQKYYQQHTRSINLQFVSADVIKFYQNVIKI